MITLSGVQSKVFADLSEDRKIGSLYRKSLSEDAARD